MNVPLCELHFEPISHVPKIHKMWYTRPISIEIWRNLQKLRNFGTPYLWRRYGPVFWEVKELESALNLVRTNVTKPTNKFLDNWQKIADIKNALATSAEAFRKILDLEDNRRADLKPLAEKKYKFSPRNPCSEGTSCGKYPHT